MYILISDLCTVFQTRGIYKIPGGLEDGPSVVESSVDPPVVDGIEVGVAVDDDPVEVDGVSKSEYGVAFEPIEASAFVDESSVTRHTRKSLVSVAKYSLPLVL